MKNLVVYSSKSGNTKKLAEAVYEYLSGDKEIAAVADAPDPAEYTFVAVGFWVKDGQPDPDSQAFLARLKDGQNVYLFATHGAAVGSVHVKNAMMKARELVAKASVRAIFSCPGEVDAKTLETAAQKNPQPAWFADAPAAKGHPDAKDLKLSLIHISE